LDLISESFKDVDCRSLDFSVNEASRKKHLKSFESGETSILVMPSEISTRRDFDFTPPAVLVNFDFPMTLQLYLYRIHKRAESHTHVYTFFSPHFDIRHTMALISALEGAKQKVPAALQKLKEQVKAEASKDGGNRREAGSRSGRTPKSDSASRAEGDDDGSRVEGCPPWKRAAEADGEQSTRHRGTRDRDREERGAREDHARESRSHSDYHEDRGESGKGSKGKGEIRERRDGRGADSNWRDGKDRREDESLGSPSSRQGGDENVRRRDTGRRPGDVGNDQKGGSNNRRDGAGGGRRERDDRAEASQTGGDRRRQWSEGDGTLEAKGSGKSSGSGSRLERTNSHGEAHVDRRSADTQASSSSNVRQRRHPEDGSQEWKSRRDGADRQRDAPGSVQVLTRGSSDNHGVRRGPRQGTS